MSVIADMYGNNAGTIGAVLGITASIFFCVGYKLHRDRKFRLARRKSEGKIKLEDGTAIRPLSPTIDSNKGNCVIVTRDMNSIDKPEMSPNSDGEDITAVEFNNLEINEMNTNLYEENDSDFITFTIVDQPIDMAVQSFKKSNVQSKANSNKHMNRSGSSKSKIAESNESEVKQVEKSHENHNSAEIELHTSPLNNINPSLVYINPPQFTRNNVDSQTGLQIQNSQNDGLSGDEMFQDALSNQEDNDEL